MKHEPTYTDKLIMLENERLTRMAGTLLAQAQVATLELGGRYAGMRPSTMPVYPAGAQWTRDWGNELEPPLGYSVEAQEPIGEVAEVEKSIRDLAEREREFGADPGAPMPGGIATPASTSPPSSRAGAVPSPSEHIMRR
jgi:hypothetical protein